MFCLQREMCVLVFFVLLGPGLTAAAKVKSSVRCGERTMTVAVEKSSLPRLGAGNFRLSDGANTACSFKANGTHIYADVPLNSCGTEISDDNEDLIFTNEVTSVERPLAVITRQCLVRVRFQCRYPKRGKVQQSYAVHRESVTVVERGVGKFTYEFEFYTDDRFKTRVASRSYPLECDLGTRVYMQIAASTVTNTQLFVETCKAAPYDNANAKPTHTIIENGCNVEESVKVHKAENLRQFRFSMLAFKFVGKHDQVYISCSVMMCEAGAAGTRCSQGCIRWSLFGKRKREVVNQTSLHLISQGPLRLRRSAEDAEGLERTGTNLNLNLVFIAGCLLAAVGMVSAVVVYKARIAEVKYRPLPAGEGDAAA